MSTVSTRYPKIRNNVPSLSDTCSRKLIKSALKDVKVKLGVNFQLVCMNAAQLGRKILEAGALELVSPLSCMLDWRGLKSCQF